MLKTSRNELYKKAAMKWGGDTQKVVAIKELSSLSYAVAKQINKKSNDPGVYLQALADAFIMIEQLAYLAGRSDFEEVLELRLVRLKCLVED
jgi:hypothetical protein